MFMVKLKNTLWLAAVVFGLAACVNIPYRAPIQQGNVIDAKRMPLIRVGMTKEQIATAIGTPVLQDIFHKDRWDYVFRLDEHYQAAEQKRITIWFVNNVASKIEQQ